MNCFTKNKRLSFEERIDPASTALVVIDVQNDFILPQGVCGRVGDDVSPVAPMIERLKELIEAARRAGVLLVFMRTIYDEPVLSPALAEQYLRRGYPNSICLTGTHGAEFYGGIEPREAPNEILLTKHRYSAFWGAPIDLVLRSNGIRTTVLTGVATEVCVELTARDAFFRDYQVVVPSDCVGSYSQDRQEASLAVMARSFGVVTSAADIQSVWRRFENGGARNWQTQERSKRELISLDSRLAPVHCALILVNLTRTAFEGDETDSTMRQCLTNCQLLLHAARRVGCLVIHAVSDTSQFIENLVPTGAEQIVFCPRTSCFAETQLEILLRSNLIRSVVIGGATTTGAIESTVREAADRDYYVTVVADGVAPSIDERSMHEASLMAMRRLFATVALSSQIYHVGQQRAAGPIRSTPVR